MANNLFSFASDKTVSSAEYSSTYDTGSYKTMELTLNVENVGGDAGILVIRPEYSNDGDKWTVHDAVALPFVNSVGTFTGYLNRLHKYLRFNYDPIPTTKGDTPYFTFDLRGMARD